MTGRKDLRGALRVAMLRAATVRRGGTTAPLGERILPSSGADPAESSPGAVAGGPVEPLSGSGASVEAPAEATTLAVSARSEIVREGDRAVAALVAMKRREEKMKRSAGAPPATERTPGGEPRPPEPTPVVARLAPAALLGVRTNTSPVTAATPPATRAEPSLIAKYWPDHSEPVRAATCPDDRGWPWPHTLLVLLGHSRRAPPRPPAPHDDPPRTLRADKQEKPT